VVYLIALCIAVSAGLLVYVIVGAMPARSRALRERMSEMGLDSMLGADAARRRSRESTKLQEVLNYVGGQVTQRDRDWTSIRRRLIMAGYRDAGALQLFLGIRFGAMGVLFTVGVLYGAVADLPGAISMAVGFMGAYAGWTVPNFMLSRRINARQTEIQKALPDALDLLVICVEAGLGLNQALVRTAAEMRHVSLLMTTEMSQANLAIRAGTPRDRALLDMAERTGVKDIRSLVTMIIQTERFGTSIANALRVHSDTMRTKRRQRAEEAAAKTTIKMVFPLAFCIFPALFVVVLGPAVIQVLITFGQLG
jgi:tight adherence protein C